MPIILKPDKFLQFDWLTGAVVFLAYFEIPTCENYKLRVVIQTNNNMICTWDLG